MEKTVGAKKRKQYKNNSVFTSRTLKESTPADSGYIETISISDDGSPTLPTFRRQDYDLLDALLEELTEIKPQQPSTSRRTARQAAILEKRSDSWYLTQAIKKHGLNIRTENSEEVIQRWTPQVSLVKLSKEQVKDLERPWNFIKKDKLIDKYEFTAKIVHRRSLPKIGATELYVEWTPSDILKNGWINSTELPAKGVRVIDIQNLSWRQKLLIGGHIPNTKRS